MFFYVTPEEYGQAYSEARNVLYRRGRLVGKPQLISGGRVCRIDDAMLSDGGIFREAWGEAVAHELTVTITYKPETDASPNCCDKLLSECVAANRDLLASIRHRREDQLESAAEKRRAARVALLAHAGAH